MQYVPGKDAHIPAPYRHYWRRKQLLAAGVPHAQLLHWWDAEKLCESERVCFESLRGAGSLLDYGAGDLRMMRRFRAAGFTGEYDTLDIGGEYDYTYRDLDQVNRAYGAILCLDVIEHMELTPGLELLERLAGLLEPGGVLIVQTPNARFVQFPLSTDMTHVQCYNAGDLWAHMTCLDLAVRPYRVRFAAPGGPPLRKLEDVWRKFVITRWLRCDFAENILLIATKQA